MQASMCACVSLALCVVRIQATTDSDAATFCNRPWSEFFERTKIQLSELWPTTVRMFSSPLILRVNSRDMAPVTCSRTLC